MPTVIAHTDQRIPSRCSRNHHLLAGVGSAGQCPQRYQANPRRNENGHRCSQQRSGSDAPVRDLGGLCLRLWHVGVLRSAFIDSKMQRTQGNPKSPRAALPLLGVPQAGQGQFSIGDTVGAARITGGSHELGLNSATERSLTKLLLASDSPKEGSGTHKGCRKNGTRRIEVW